MSGHGQRPDGAEEVPPPGEEQVEARAVGLPEEENAEEGDSPEGDDREQAAAILSDSEARVEQAEEREERKDEVESRTSEDTTEPL